MSGVIWIAVLVAVLVAAGAVLLRYGTRWGSTSEERARPLPGDRYLDEGRGPRVVMTRSVSLRAPPAQVWPWIAQTGRGAGWYSYDRLDNGGRMSARHLVSWIPAPRLGDAGPVGYLRHLDTEHELSWWLDGGRFFGARVRNAMQYRVTGDGVRSRLVARMQAEARGPLARFSLWLYRILDTIMARRQLLGIKARVEEHGHRTADPEHPETGARDQFQLYHFLYAAGGEAGVPGEQDAPRWRRTARDDGVLGHL